MLCEREENQSTSLVHVSGNDVARRFTSAWIVRWAWREIVRFGVRQPACPVIGGGLTALGGTRRCRIEDGERRSP